MRQVGSVVLALALASCTGADDAAPCAEAIRSHGWCQEAGVGYVASVEIVSPALYEALDSHGHDVDPAVMGCETCVQAAATDGFCPEHRMGYVDGLAYLSPLTYELARSRPADPRELTCPECRRNARSIGWCDIHRLGMVGGLAMADAAGFARLEAAYRVLLAAVERSAECEMCAAAMVADGTCPFHRITFRNGRALPPSP